MVGNPAVSLKIEKLFEDGFVVIDLETTDFSSNPTVEVVDVCVLDHQGKTLMETLVKSEHGISPGAFRVHGISEEDVEDAPLFQDIYPQLAGVLKDQTLFAYNYTFEQDILNSIIRRLKLAQLEPKAWHCAMRDYSAYTGRRKYAKLTNACRQEGVRIINAHRAIGDCLMTLALLKKMAGIT